MISHGPDLCLALLQGGHSPFLSRGLLLLHINPGAEKAESLVLEQRTERTRSAGTGIRGEPAIPESQTCVLSVVAFMNVHVLKPRLIFLFKHWFKIVGSGRDTVLQQVFL